MKYKFELFIMAMAVMIFCVFYITSEALVEASEERKRIEVVIAGYEKQISELRKDLEMNEQHMDDIVRCVVTGEWEKDPREN